MAEITAPGKILQLFPILAPSIIVTLEPIQHPSPISTSSLILTNDSIFTPLPILALGDIFENEAGSKFSWAPITIKLYQDDPRIDELSKSFDKKAIGNLAVRKDVEVKTFQLQGEEHIDHPVRVWMTVPKNIFESVAKTLELNSSHKKLGSIEFKVKVAKKQLLDLHCQYFEYCECAKSGYQDKTACLHLK